MNVNEPLQLCSRTVIEAYPKAGAVASESMKPKVGMSGVPGASRQEGQDGVDQGGWSFAVDDLSSKGAVQRSRLEFLVKSCSNSVCFRPRSQNLPKMHFCFQDMHDWNSFQVAYQDYQL